MKAWLFAALVSDVFATSHDITAYGAVAGIDTEAVATVNGQAFAAAIYAANTSSIGNRSVLVPSGIFSFLPSVPGLPGLVDVTIYVEGELSLFDANMTKYPGWSTCNPWVPFSFQGATGLVLTSTSGRGVINGRGRDWWWHAILIRDCRPNLFEASGSTISLFGVTFLNSPAWHVWLSPVQGVTITNCTVRVDIDDQLDALRYIGGSRSKVVTDVLAAARLIAPASPESIAALAETPENSNSLSAARVAAIPHAVRAAPWFKSEWTITPVRLFGVILLTIPPLSIFFSRFMQPIPMIWALNTDGFDFAGVNVSVNNCTGKECSWDLYFMRKKS